MKPIAFISEAVITALKLDMAPGTPVFIGETNLAHIRNRHPYEYEKYLPDTGLIINSPDYVGLSPKDSWALVSKLQALEEERDGPEVELARAEIKKPRLTGEMIGERPSFNFLQYKRKRTAL